MKTGKMYGGLSLAATALSALSAVGCCIFIGWERENHSGMFYPSVQGVVLLVILAAVLGFSLAGIVFAILYRNTTDIEKARADIHAVVLVLLNIFIPLMLYYSIRKPSPDRRAKIEKT